MTTPYSHNSRWKACSRALPTLAAGFTAATVFLAGTPSAEAQTPLTFQPGYHRVGPIAPRAMGEFPEWYQDKTGLTLEFGTPLTPTELAGGYVLLLPVDTVAPETYVYPRAVPSTFFDEHFYWHSAVTDKIGRAHV